jgi:Mor family transcriptional regulator
MKLKPKKEISEKNKAILEMRRNGKSIVEIGEWFRLSRQRIFAILKRYGDPLDD